MKKYSQAISTGSSTPLWNLVVGWVMLVPFMFFAADGNFPLALDPSLRVASTGAGPVHSIGVAVVGGIFSILVFLRFHMVWGEILKAKTLLIIPLLAAVSCLWSEIPGKSLLSGTILLLATLFAFYVHGRYSPQKIFEMIVFCAAISLFAGLLLVVAIPNIGTTTDGWRGTFGHKNNAGVVGIFFLLTVLHWKPRGVFQKTLAVFVGVLSLVFIVMAKSRNGWGLAVFATFLLVVIWTLQHLTRKQSLVAAFGGIPLFSGIGYALYYYAPLLLQAVGKDPTLSQRTIIWAAVWDAVIQRPVLGYGYAAFWNGMIGPSLNIALIANWILNQAQNGYLDLWLQLGFVAVLVLAFMIAQAGINAVRCLHGTGENGYVRWCIVVLLVVLTYNVGESSLEITHLTWFLFLLAYLGLNDMALKAKRRSALLKARRLSLPKQPAPPIGAISPIPAPDLQPF
jgi:exopolysaccharide production protein ExoQ